MTRPALHVLMYSDLRSSSGGRETWLAYFLPRLAARGVLREVVVHHMRALGAAEDALPPRLLAACAGAPTAVRFAAAPLALHGRAGPLARFAAFTTSALARLARDARPGDVVLAVGFHGEAPPACLAALAGRLLARRLRLVTWLREGSLELVADRRGALVHAAARRLLALQLARSDRIVTNGRDTQARFLEGFPALAGRFVCLPNALAAPALLSLPPPDWSAPRWRVGFVGRLSPAKGAPAFGAAAALARGRPEAAGLEFAAWGRAEGAGDLGSVTLHAPLPQPRIGEAYAACHVVAFLNDARYASGVSHAALEALAAGRLVVAWDDDCHRQVFEGAGATLVPPGDVGALVRALVALRALSTAALAERAALARARAAAHDADAHVERFVREVLGPLLEAGG